MRRVTGIAAVLALATMGCGDEPAGGTDTNTGSPMGASMPATGDEPSAGAGANEMPAQPGASEPPSEQPGGPPTTGGDDPTREPPTNTPAEPGFARDECGISTRYAGDDLCILPPPEAEGFQLHIGPADYENPDPSYVLAPGQEATTSFPAVSGNAEDIYFYYRQYRMRPGAHHMIVYAGADGSTFGMGRRIGTANISQDSPPGGKTAPENEGVGIDLPAKTNLSVSLHSINVTDEPVLREVWVNFWYRDAAAVTEPALQLFKSGSTSFEVAPGQDTILGPYTCDITAEGRLLWFYGHRHANNVRFSAWRVRGGQRDLFYEGLHWEEPLLLEYSSTVQNTAPDRERNIEGGWSGVLDLQPGDQLEWECHVINQRPTPLRFTNETYDGEMCIMDGETVGTGCTSSGGGAGFPGAPQSP